MAGGSTPPAHETATAQTKPNSIIDDSDAVDVSSTPLADGNGASSGPDARPKRRQSKRRGSRRHSTEDEPPPESLGCNETHHKAVLVLREIRDHTAFTLFFILAILYSGVIVSNCSALCRRDQLQPANIYRAHAQNVVGAQVGVGLYDEVTSQPGMRTYMSISEVVVGVLFTIEVSVKILAEGETSAEALIDMAGNQ